MDTLSFLASIDTPDLVLLFWFAIVFELPRYLIGAIVVAVAELARRPAAGNLPDFSVSVLLVGHNEAAALDRCVHGLAAQTIARRRGRMQVIVVDDGSTDGMSAVARQLQTAGLVDEVMRVQPRGGKSAGVNLGLSRCRGDIVVIADIDTTFDDDAIDAFLPFFGNPRVGAVSGDLGVRNVSSNLITRQQAIEYLITISLGRRIADALGILSIVSGAFGAFRRSAVASVGGQDVEVGEDADMTMKLRRAGWRIRFAPEARALTHVPETMAGLIAQRLRWERGTVTIWLRKFRGILDPRQAIFRLSDVGALLDVLFFQLALTLVFPGYVLWLWLHLGVFAVTVLGAVLLGYAVLDLLAFALAASLGADMRSAWRLLPYLPWYTIMQTVVMRWIRLIAIGQELVWRRSYRDPYVPFRVMSQVDQG